MSARTRLIFEGENRTQRAFSAIQRSTTGLTRSFQGLNSVAGKFGLALGVAAAANFARGATNSAVAIKNFSDQLGVSVEQFSQFQFVAKQAGISQQSFSTGIQRLLRRTAEAAKGIGVAADSFKQFGIDAKAFGNLDLEQQLFVLAEEFNNTADANERLRLAVSFFDTEGATFLRILNGGAKSLRDARDASRDFATVTEEAADSAIALDAAVGRVQRKLGNLVLTGLELAGSQGSVVDWFTSARDASIDFVDRGLTNLGIINESLDPSGNTGIPFYLQKVAADAREATDAVEGLAEAQAAVTKAPDTRPASGTLFVGQLEAIRQAQEAIRETQRQDFAAGQNAILAFRRFKSEEATDFSDTEAAISQAIRAGAETGADGLVTTLLQTVQSSLISNLAGLIAGGLSGTGGGGGLLAGVGRIFGFNDGGVVPGPRGSAQLAVVHGGETILPTHRQDPGGAGMTVNVDARGAGPEVGPIVRSAVLEAVAISTRNVVELNRKDRLR